VIEGIIRISKWHETQGHRVELISLDRQDANWVNACPVAVTALGTRTSSYGYSKNLVDWLRCHAPRFDAVVVNGLWQYGSFGVWRAMAGRGAKRQGATNVGVMTRGGNVDSTPPYFVFPHGMLDPWFKRQYPMKHFKKWLYWPWAEYRVLRDARAVLFSNQTERTLARKSFWLYRCREAIAGYGVSLPAGDDSVQREAFMDVVPSLGQSKFFLFLSRLHEKKGPDLAIRAFGALQRAEPERMRSYRLVVAGPAVSEEYLSKLKQIERENCVPGTVLWTGMLSVDQKWGAMRTADAFLLPSHQENYGLAVAEALACKLPVLISTAVNVWEDVVGDGAGIAEPATEVGVRRLIERWLQLSDQQKALMREEASRCFNSRFEASRKATEMIEVFRQNGARG